MQNFQKLTKLWHGEMLMEYNNDRLANDELPSKVIKLETQLNWLVLEAYEQIIKFNFKCWIQILKCFKMLYWIKCLSKETKIWVFSTEMKLKFINLGALCVISTYILS